MSTVTEYAAAVRAALADIPQADREELLEDLEEHLAEVAAEHDGPLEGRLGTPQSYAAELRAAYTDAAPVKTRRGARELLSTVDVRRRRVKDSVLPPGSTLRVVLGDLRPIWWVARGYFTGFLLNAILGEGRAYIPNDPFALLVMLLAVCGSVWLGSRARRGAPRRTAAVLAVAALTGLGLLGGMAFAATAEDDHAEAVAISAGPLGDVANIYVFTKDGKPVKDVLLYDQWGEPILTAPEGWGYIERGGDPLMGNLYPKEICAVNGMVSAMVPSCPGEAQGFDPYDSAPTFPAVAPTATVPAEPFEPEPVPTGSASPEARPSPSESPTATPSAAPTE
ncbi:hypothetical protein GCM10022221_04270 [Actinocorallia aurea]